MGILFSIFVGRGIFGVPWRVFMDGFPWVHDECRRTNGFLRLLDGAPIRREFVQTLTLWNWVQLLIIAVVIFDLIFFRFQLTAGETGRTSTLFDVVLLTYWQSSIVTAYLKAKWTKKHTLISALFFMIVITTLEWLPALMVRSGNIDSWVTILLFPLLAVNAYQLLMLPKYNRQSDEDKARLDARKKRDAKAA